MGGPGSVRLAPMRRPGWQWICGAPALAMILMTTLLAALSSPAGAVTWPAPAAAPAAAQGGRAVAVATAPGMVVDAVPAPLGHSDLGMVEAELPLLKANHLTLDVAVVQGSTSFATLAGLVRQAHGDGVPVELRPLLSIREGVYAGDRTATAFGPWWSAVQAFVLRNHLPVRVLVYDVQPDWALQQRLNAMIASSGFAKTLQFLLGRISPILYLSGAEEIAAQVAQAQHNGFLVDGTTVPFVLDDYGQVGQVMQAAFDAPIAPIPWDAISFQVYRSTFDRDFASIIGQHPLSPFLITSYARTAQAWFGSRAQIDLGPVGATDDTMPADLLADVSAVRGAGIDPRSIDVSSLEGLVAQPAPAAWVDLNAAPPTAPRRSLAVNGIRRLIATIRFGSPLA